MATEVCLYRLLLRDKPVGHYQIATSFKGRTALLEASMTLSGRLGHSSVRQLSKSHRQQFFSFSYYEESGEGKTQRSYRVEFDIVDGLVKASKGADSASVPYTRPYEDPLGLLYHLRQLPPESGPLTVPMLGHDVIVEPLGTVTLETAEGERSARMYQLLPGKSYVYVDVEPPHVILRLTQRVDGQLLEAQLSRRETQADGAERRGRRRRARNRRSS